MMKYTITKKDMTNSQILNIIQKYKKLDPSKKTKKKGDSIYVGKCYWCGIQASWVCINKHKKKKRRGGHS